MEEYDDEPEEVCGECTALCGDCRCGEYCCASLNDMEEAKAEGMMMLLKAQEKKSWENLGSNALNSLQFIADFRREIGNG